MSTSPSLTSPEYRKLIEQAVLAPSSHNTQPWRFEVHESHISLFADRIRALPVNDPHDRELTISCGCALMNLRVAAADAGFSIRVNVLPDAEDEDRLATVELSRAGEPDEAEARLCPAISRRRTYRKRFASRAVPESLLEELTHAASREGAEFEYLVSESTREKAAALVSEGDSMQWDDPSWRRELAAWMHPRRKGDGLAMPGMVAAVARVVVRTFDMGNGVGAKDHQLADESPVLAVLTTKGDVPANWLAAGQALQRVLLTACQNGLQASYLNQPIQVEALRPRLRDLLMKSGHPQVLLRLGYPDEDLPPSPRRPVEDVID